MKEILQKLGQKLESDDLSAEEIALVENFVREHFNEDGSLVFDLEELLREEIRP